MNWMELALFSFGAALAGLFVVGVSVSGLGRYLPCSPAEAGRAGLVLFLCGIAVAALSLVLAQ